MPHTPRGSSARQDSDPPCEAPLAAVRAGLFALVGLALGATSHHLLSGQALSWPRVGAAGGLLFAVGLFGARRRRSLTAVAASCLAAQAVLHEVLGGLHVTHPAGATSARGHGHHAASMAYDGRVLAGHEAWHERLQHSLALTMTHVLVALVIAVVMHRADVVCWSVAAGGASAVALVVASIGRVFSAWAWTSAGCRPEPAPRPSMRWERSPPKPSLLADVVVRRGPPQGFALA